jgi:RNA polymerase sigma-70 factor, ECF subfamily
VERKTKLGRFSEARKEIERALTLTQNLRERELLAEKLKQIEKKAAWSA